MQERESKSLRYFFEKLAEPAQPPDIENPGCMDAAIHDLARGGTVAALKNRLDLGADPNARNDNGWTPLHLADSPEKARILLDAGADPRLMHYGGYTPLQAVIANSSGKDMAGKLLSFYLENLPVEALLQKTYHRQDSLLHLAARHGMEDMALIQKIIDIGVPVNALDLHKQTPLQTACENGRVDIARILIKNGADVNKPPDNASFLAFAIYERSGAMVKILIESGIDVNASHDVTGRSPLAMAVSGGSNEDIVKLLLDAGADPNHQCHEGKTALHYLIEAVQKKQQRPVTDSEERSLCNALQLLIKAGSNPELKDIDGKRPYEYALTFSMTQAMDFLEGAALGFQRREARRGQKH